MPSFDIVSKTDLQRLDNYSALPAKKSPIVWFQSFQNNYWTRQKEMMIHVLTENDIRMKTVEGIIIFMNGKAGTRYTITGFW